MAATMLSGPPMRVVPVSIAAAVEEPRETDVSCIDIDAIGMFQYFCWVTET